VSALPAAPFDAEAKPRVVHLTTTDVTLDWLLGPQLEAFAAAGFDVIGCSAPGPYVASIERRGIPHVAVQHATRAMAPAEDARAVAELVALFRRLRPSIVHTHNPKPGLYGRVAARLAGVPVVVNTVHGLYAQPEDPWAKRAIVYFVERAASTCSNAELVQNPEDVETLARLKVPRRKLTLLGNGIDLVRFDPRRIDGEVAAAARSELGAQSPDDVVVGLVGRLVIEKGYRDVFAAAAELHASLPNVRFAVIGQDEPEKSDAVTAADRRVASAAGVRLLGERHDVERLYRGMDIFVHASYREGFPRSAMEAAAMGLPIVATDIRGCRQVVEHDRTGLLVPPRDARALAAAVGALARDAPRRQAMGAAGTAKAAREFDQQRCIDITIDTYRRLLAERV
jgi:glycosyltransferase involved in cell wall biosynthesis